MPCMGSTVIPPYGTSSGIMAWQAPRKQEKWECLCCLMCIIHVGAAGHCVRLTPVCEISLSQRSIQADIVSRKGKRENTLVEKLLQDGRLRRLFGDMAGVVVAVVVTIIPAAVV